MLELAQAKSQEAGESVAWVQGNALELPFDAGEFDAATVGFGARNVVDLEQGIREMARVVRPGGRVVILEITTPQPASAELVLRRVVRPGRCPCSAPSPVTTTRTHTFPIRCAASRRPHELAALMHGVGLRDVRYLLLAGGIIAIHSATVAA